MKWKNGGSQNDGIIWGHDKKWGFKHYECFSSIYFANYTFAMDLDNPNMLFISIFSELPPNLS